MQTRNRVAAPEPTSHRASRQWMLLLLSIALFLALFTVYDQVVHRKGLDYLWDTQLRFHRWILEGVSVSPWQYRVFSPYVIEGIIRILQELGHPAPHALVFVAFRVLQNMAIFTLCGLYWRRLGVSRNAIIIGLMCLAWGMTYAGYRSHLAFDTYSDVVFYLIGGLLVLSRRDFWLVPLTALAALNRETSALLPFLLPAARLEVRSRLHLDRKTTVIWIAGLLIFCIIYVGLRLTLGPRAIMTPYDRTIGLDLLFYNAANLYTYFSLFATFAFFPLLAMVRWKQWPHVLRRFFWVVMPIWVAVHIFASVVAEARLFLVPYVLILLPAALISLGGEEGRLRRLAAKSSTG